MWPVTGYGRPLHVDDCDKMARRAVEAGAEMVAEPSNQFYGERSCRIRDPFSQGVALDRRSSGLVTVSGYLFEGG